MVDLVCQSSQDISHIRASPTDCRDKCYDKFHVRAPAAMECLDSRSESSERERCHVESMKNCGRVGKLTLRQVVRCSML